MKLSSHFIIGALKNVTVALSSALYVSTLHNPSNWKQLKDFVGIINQTALSLQRLCDDISRESTIKKAKNEQS